MSGYIATLPVLIEFVPLILLGSINSPCFGQSVEQRELRIIEQVPPAEIRLQHGSFVALYRKPHPFPAAGDQWVSVRDQDWKEKFLAVPGRDMPDTFSFSLYSAAMSSGGGLAVAGIAWSDRGQAAHVVAFYDVRLKRLVRLVRTEPTICREVGFDSNENLWCVGSDVNALREGHASYDLLYKYSKAGVLLAKGIPRPLLPAGGTPEVYHAKGGPRIFFTQADEPIVVFPSIDMFVTTKDNAVATKTWRPKLHTDKMSYTLASTGSGCLLGLLPTDPESGISDGRYRVHELVEARTSGGPVRSVLSSPSDILAVRWSLRAETLDRHFAGKSNELVGVDKGQPVIWNRSSSVIIWLNPLEP